MLRAIFAKALPLCEPSFAEKRRVSAVALKAKSLVDKQVAGSPDIVSVVFGGSFAKGTWLHSDADIDIFFKVRPSVALEKFEEFGKSIGQKAFENHNPKLRYSDHPYVEAYLEGLRINVVPCYDVDQGKWKSAADRSPFHTEFICRNFNDEKRKHARLLKKFLKSVRVYGAEISTGGFSGYVSEVLILKYDSLEGVLGAAAGWRDREVVSIGDYDSDIIKGFTSPLIIIDPVDSRRNLGTAISSESAGNFILAARAFLKTPSIQFFRQDKNLSRSSTLIPNVLVVEFSHRERSPDVLWGQLKRSMNAITRQLELADFIVLRSSCITNEKRSAAFAFLLESMMLPSYTKKKGPEVFRRSDTASFLAAKKKPLATWVDGMRVSMLIRRKETDARKFTKLLLHNAENSGIVKDLIAGELQVYSGESRNPKGLARQAVNKIISTEHFIFQ